MKTLIASFRRLSLGLASIAVVAALTACGGGGGSAGTSIVGGGSSGSGSGSGSTTGTTDTATLTLKLSSTTVTAGAPATVSVSVVNKSGAVIPGLVVKFSTDSNLGTFSASSALTDASGTAAVTLSPAQANLTGADNVKATVTYLSKDYSASTGFQLSATNVAIAAFTSDVATLSAYGQANLTVTLSGTTATTPVSLSMTSACVTAGKGTLTPSSQTTSTGKATFTFRDGGCGAQGSGGQTFSDSLTVSVAGTTLTQSLNIPISSPVASSIGFVSASPTAIYLKGSGLVENSNVTFQVKDANNNGLPGQSVVLTPNVLVGGLQLDGQSGSVTKITDTNGNVIVRVNSGTVPTPVRIKATLQGSNISTVSSALAIAVGLPSQLNFSLSQGAKNIEGYNRDGTPNTYTIYAADRLGNPVPDGTSINFVAEGGQIQAIRQTALNGNGLAFATANSVTAQPVPVDGRVTIVAYALGEKSFLDANGNNVYDQGEDFQDLGDIYIDRKFDGFYNSVEDQFISLSLGGSLPCVPATSSLLATDVTIPSRPNTCSQAWGQTYVRRAAQTIYSTSEARPMWGNTWPDNAYGNGGVCPSSLSLITGYANDAAITQTYKSVVGTTLYKMSKSGAIAFMTADNNPVAYNPMAAGTTVSVTATTGLSVTMLGGTPVPSISAPSGAAFSYKFDDTTVSGTVTLVFTSPSGFGTAVSFLVSQADPPNGYAACTN